DEPFAFALSGWRFEDGCTVVLRSLARCSKIDAPFAFALAGWVFDDDSTVFGIPIGSACLDSGTHHF
ncbi:MAG: hypothetical protein K2Z81_18245, partial [Cyanobacteria bacterium]|nr:hypothetical protein [Cyanobacteriota bacterium]